MNIELFLSQIKDRNLKKEFITSLQSEISDYEKSKNSKSNSSTIEISGNVANESFTNSDLVYLLSQYQDKILNELELEYILNGLEFAGLAFEEKAEKVINQFASPEINTPINYESIKSGIEFLLNN